MKLPPLGPQGSKIVATRVIAAGLMIFIALWAFPTLLAAQAGKSAPKPALTVELTQARPSEVPIKLVANGSIAAWQEASVGAEASGLRVLEVKADIGDLVERGQVLLTFAAESVEADVALVRAGVAEARANSAEAKANADRARSVQGKSALSAQQINQYLTIELTAQARVASAKAQLDAQLLRLKHTTLVAPDSGIVSMRTANVGAVVGAGTEMFRMIRQGRLEWRAEVTSVELGRIAPGTEVLVIAPSGAQMPGKVRTVAPTVDPASRAGLVYVDLLIPAASDGTANPGTTPATGPARALASASFKPGMFAKGEFELGHSKAMVVAQSAVVLRDGFSYVYRVAADQRVSQLKVETGRILGDQIEIRSGISAEDQLVLSGGSFLSDGDLVRVVNARKPSTSIAPASGN